MTTETPAPSARYLAIASRVAELGIVPTTPAEARTLEAILRRVSQYEMPAADAAEWARDLYLD